MIRIYAGHLSYIEHILPIAGVSSSMSLNWCKWLCVKCLITIYNEAIGLVHLFGHFSRQSVVFPSHLTAFHNHDAASAPQKKEVHLIDFTFPNQPFMTESFLCKGEQGQAIFSSSVRIPS